MATKILYSNKIVLQNDETIPSENKVTADDMNEIKEVVNNNADELETKQGKEEGKGLSTNDFTDELKEKLESLENYDDTELKQKNTEQDETIEELKAENIELKAENKRLNNDINAISVTEKAEGENITLNDTAEARFKKFGIGGNSWQETGDVTDEEGNVIGTMPSTQFKSDIQNVTGNVNVTVCNKNVANLEIVNSQFRVTTEKINANTFKVTRTATGSCYGQIEMNLKKNTTYTVYFKCSDSNAYLALWNDYNGNNYIKYSVTEPCVFTTTQEKLVIGMYLNPNGTVGDEATFEIMIIESSNTDEVFAEHKEQSFTFPLQEGQKLMLNDYLADNGIHHKRGRYVFTGDEVNVIKKWEDEANVFFFQRLVQYQEDTSNLQLVGCKCNKYECTHYDDGKGSMWAERLTNRDLFAITYKISKTNIENNGVLIKDNRFSTIEELLDNLKEQCNNGTPVYFEYILAEEEIEAYTPEQQAVYDEIKKTAHSYGEQTHIFCTDETSLIFNVEARKDTNTLVTRIEKLESEV